jgi:hypothetical protein
MKSLLKISSFFILTIIQNMTQTSSIDKRYSFNVKSACMYALYLCVMCTVCV